MAFEAWEIIVVVIIILLLKPSIVRNAAGSLGKVFGEYKKGKSGIFKAHLPALITRF